MNESVNIHHMLLKIRMLGPRACLDAVQKNGTPNPRPSLYGLSGVEVNYFSFIMKPSYSVNLNLRPSKPM
jgi:hypothetical protein